MIIKILFSILLFAVASPVFAYSVTPQTYSSGDELITIVVAGQETYASYDSTGELFNGGASTVSCATNEPVCGDPTGGFSDINGDFRILILKDDNNIDGDCYATNSSYSDCVALYSDEILADYLITYVPAEVSQLAGIGALISSSNEQFASTTGFSVGSTVMWTADSFIKLIIGSGLGVLWELRYWIVALILIYTIVVFGYRGLKFIMAGPGRTVIYTGKTSRIKIKK